MSDSLAPHRVLPLLRGRFGRPYAYRGTCATTQRLLGVNLPEGAVAVCEEQTAGRGRAGHRWEAPKAAGILCSVLLRPPREREWPQLSLVAGLAVAETVELLTDRAAAIKWPNDVLLDGGKVAGLLAETREDVVVLGIGMNVNQRADQLPATRQPQAVSLFTVDGIERDRAPALAALLARLERRYDAWVRNDLESLHDALTARDALRGLHVEVGGVQGVAAGFDNRGRLTIDAEGARQSVASGEVTVLGL